MKFVETLIGVVALLVFLGWLGLRILPAPFPAYPKNPEPMKTIPLPNNLPAPVERFYRKVYGDHVPVIETAVISGRARLRPFGPTYLPSRFRFTHIAGQSYRHYIETTFWGIPFLKINERYLEGKSLFVTPVGSVDNDPKLNQGANLGLWAEAIWFPSVFITDPRVRWESVDDHTAWLIVPFEDTSERFMVRFDPDSGLITLLESMRYRGPESRSKILWMNEPVAWGEVNGIFMMKTGSAIWLDQYTPWAFFTVEDAVFNANIGGYIQREGP